MALNTISANVAVATSTLEIRPDPNILTSRDNLARLQDQYAAGPGSRPPRKSHTLKAYDADQKSKSGRYLAIRAGANQGAIFAA
jgi:hypothetical protein